MANVAATTSSHWTAAASGSPERGAGSEAPANAAGQETKGVSRTSAPRPVPRDRKEHYARNENDPRLHRVLTADRHGEQPERRQDTDSSEGGGRRAHGNVAGPCARAPTRLASVPREHKREPAAGPSCLYDGRQEHGGRYPRCPPRERHPRGASARSPPSSTRRP